MSKETSSQVESLKAEIASLKKQVAELSKKESGKEETVALTETKEDTTHDKEKAISVIVIGASGDLAKKKTYPALYSLYSLGLIPKHSIIAGYARSALSDSDFKTQILAGLKKDNEERRQAFISRCFYFSGQYDSSKDFSNFSAELNKRELENGGKVGANRVFYMAIPPTIFVSVGKGIQPHAMTTTGWNRVIVEKPFGMDSETSAELGRQLGALFSENQIYRIDHYLGKEMVQNLMVLRFANQVFEPLWNRDHIKTVQITFKEDFGTKGRGGYFDAFGIIRDVMQNHLLQILSLVGMEPPVSMSAEDVRDEKVKLLRAIRPIIAEDLVIGQYAADPKGSESSYLDDPTVPKGSITPTFAAAVLHINNVRWRNVPFILKCGKALNERKAEIRIQFRRPLSGLYGDQTSPNELVLRVQPDEAVYLKMTTKKPGLGATTELSHTELDLSYKHRFKEEAKNLPDAYERLILDVVRGDHNLFVRSDELSAAWKIFTPILHKLEKEKIKPLIYQFGSRGPPEADAMIAKYGYERTVDYVWTDPRSK